MKCPKCGEELDCFTNHNGDWARCPRCAKNYRPEEVAENWQARAERAEAALAERDAWRCATCNCYDVKAVFCDYWALTLNAEDSCTEWVQRPEPAP